MRREKQEISKKTPISPMPAKALSNISLHYEEARLLKALQVMFASEAHRFCSLNEAVGRCIRSTAEAHLGTTRANEIALDRNYKPTLPYRGR